MIQAADIQAFLFEDQGFPRLNWEEAGEWIEEKFNEEEQDKVLEEMIYLWLEFVASSFDEEYHIFESDHFILLTINDQDLAQSVINICEKHFKQMEKTLKNIIPDESSGKFPILLFDGEAVYNRYVSYYFPEEDIVLPDGMALYEDLIHIAAPINEINDMDFMLLIELCHGLLADIPLPYWIDEGLVVTVERLNEKKERPNLTAQDREDLKQYWSKANIQDFWMGDSFSIEEENIFSYRLAELLIDTIFHDYKEDAADFIQNAHYKDAGEKAASNYLEKSLSEILTDILGQGNWAVKPSEWDLDEDE